ncbi:hypothetical protein TNCV_517241 [Trichonephila clavipes]|nr:hypothetical protein TNCV_517241 [Trichonephila clavipes]
MLQWSIRMVFQIVDIPMLKHNFRAYAVPSFHMNCTNASQMDLRIVMSPLDTGNAIRLNEADGQIARLLEIWLRNDATLFDEVDSSE